MAVTSKDMTIRTRAQDFYKYISAYNCSASIVASVSLDGVTYGTGVTYVAVNSRHVVAQFPDATDAFIIGGIQIPENYITGTDIEIEVLWSASATTGNVRFNVGLTEITSGTYDLDLANDNVTYSGIATYAAPGTVDLLMRNTVTISGTNFVAGDVTNILMARKGLDGADTMTGNLWVIGFLIKFKIDRYGE